MGLRQQCIHFSFAFEASAQVVLSAFTSGCIKVHNGRHECSCSLWPEVAHPQLNLSHEHARACLDASREAFNVIEKVLKIFAETMAYENILA